MSDEPTVLLVEDDEDILETYRLWLADDYDLRLAADGEEALELLDGTVAVAVLDRLMPGPSGAEVLGSIRERHPDCRVTMATAVEPDFDVIDMGFDAYLVKPVTEDDLRGTITNLLERSAYTETLEEYTRLLAKREALRASKPREALADSEAYADLQARLAALDEDLDATVVGTGDEAGFIATLRGIGGDAGGDGGDAGDGDTFGSGDGDAFGAGDSAGDTFGSGDDPEDPREGE